MRLLVVDDEASQRELLAGFLRKNGYHVVTAADGREALQCLQDSGAEAALVDMRMPGMDGLAFVRNALETNPDLAVVIITAYGTVETAVEAMKAGAFDYILKPIELEQVQIILKRIESGQRLLAENRYLKRKLEQVEQFEGIIGVSRAIQKVLSDIARVSRSDATVLIRGESGTGKELVARAIHLASDRSKGPLLTVNCSAIPESLLESELFGHERGAFTGARSRHLGRFELANHGTIFLDEIGDMPLAIQAKLLRVLETKRFQRLGGEKEIGVDVRILAATNRDLESKINRNEFREDLFYRLNVIPIRLPPLRERREDILCLTEYFIGKYNRKNNKKVRGITPRAKDLLLGHHWPGNVRELENLIERAIVLCAGDVIDADDIDPFVGRRESRSSFTGDLNLEKLEKAAIEEALSRVGGNLKRAAQLLGIHRNTIRLKIAKYGIKPSAQ